MSSNPETAPIPEATKAVTKFSAEHGREVGLPSPEAINYMMSVANLLANSAVIGPDMGLSKFQVQEYRNAGWTPEAIEEKNIAVIKANAMAKMLIGREMPAQIPPLAAQQEMNIVKGKIFMHYSTLLSQMVAKGIAWKQIERSNTKAALEIKIPGQDEPILFEYTIEDARMAGLIRRSKDGEALQYELRPRVMLWARVVSEAYRATGGRANVYSHEERREVLQDIEEPAEAARPNQESNPFQVSAEPKAAQEKEPTIVPEQPRTDPVPADVKPETAETLEPEAEPVENSSLESKPARGRRASPKEGLDAMNALKQSAPPEQFKAGEDDVPANIGGPQLVTPEPISQQARLKAIEALLAKEAKREPEAIRTALFAFLRSFLRIDRLPKPPDARYEEHLPLFESYAKLYGAKILVQPKQEAETARVSWDKFVRAIDPWPADMKALATQVAVQHYPDEVYNLIEFMCDTTGITEPDKQMWTFLQVLRISKEALVKLREVASGREVPLDDALEGVNLETASEKDILTALAGGPAAEAIWDE